MRVRLLLYLFLHEKNHYYLHVRRKVKMRRLLRLLLRLRGKSDSQVRQTKSLHQLTRLTSSSRWRMLLVS